MTLGAHSLPWVFPLSPAGLLMPVHLILCIYFFVPCVFVFCSGFRSPAQWFWGFLASQYSCQQGFCSWAVTIKQNLAVFTVGLLVNAGSSRREYLWIFLKLLAKVAICIPKLPAVRSRDDSSLHLDHLHSKWRTGSSAERILQIRSGS